MREQLPSFQEDHISQRPALQRLQNLGWEYLTPAETVSLRGGKLSGVNLDGIRIPQLRKLNKNRFKGREYEFSEANVQSAVQAIKELPFDDLGRSNEKIYDLLVPGKSLSQTIDGDHRRDSREGPAESVLDRPAMAVLRAVPAQPAGPEIRGR